ncbi:hypothetical protein [Anaerobutyricum hallii]|uniref:hypothetical protein n=1 Tax=Anaerobutyricum hallii TaxID=39488 RepID=UPI002ED63318
MNKANLIIEEVNKVIIGKEKVIRKVWMTILSGGHVLLEDGRYAIGCGRFLLL